jgi:hypothetical protein
MEAMAISRQSARRSIRQELQFVALGDERLDRRAVSIGEKLASRPGESLPRLCVSDSELEATYRFLNNDRFSWEDVLAPHVAATAARCAAAGRVRILHDTSDAVFSGDREGLGVVMQKTKGFFFHPALAVTRTDRPVPLGVLGTEAWARPEKLKVALDEQKARARQTPREMKESSRWERAAAHAQQQLPSDVEAVHVMDQEADDFALYAQMLDRELRFVIRGSDQRLLSRNHGPHVGDALEDAGHQMLYEVALSERKPSGGKEARAHPARERRVAQLHIRALPAVVMERPQHAQVDVESVTLNVVQVFEPNPPAGENPISWTLYTTEPVDTLDEQVEVVSDYCNRWLIEEFFKALKTGCGFEKRQLTSLDALLKLLALFLPVAWRLLAIRSTGRDGALVPAHAIFSDGQLKLLRLVLKDKGITASAYPLKTGRDVMLGIAKLGGHLKRNGDPGWITLGRGWEDFLFAERVAHLVRRGEM